MKIPLNTQKKIAAAPSFTIIDNNDDEDLNTED